MKRILLLALPLLFSLAQSRNALAQACSYGSDCGANGHTSTVTTASPITGVSYPYSEDISHPAVGSGSASTPFGDVTVTYNSSLDWTEVQTGCAYVSEKNVNSSGAFNLLLRAQPTVVSATASSGARFEIQLRLATSTTDTNPVIASWELRRLKGTYPQAEHVGGTLQNVAAGTYVYSMWIRMLDSGSATFSNAWTTAQGVPNSYPSARSVASSDSTVTTTWAAVGPQLSFTSSTALDLALGGAFQVVSGTSPSNLLIGYSLDGASSGNQYGDYAIPSNTPLGYNVFDHRKNVASGSHTLQMWMKTTTGTATVRYATAEFVSFPVTSSSPLLGAMNESGVLTNTVHITNSGSSPAPAGLNQSCGNWTEVMSFDVPAVTGDVNWIYEGFVQYLGNVSGSTRGELAIENTHWNLDAFGNKVLDAAGDHGVSAIQATAGEDGIYFYGDAMRWGSGNGGNTIKLWMRRINGCASGVTNNSTDNFDIGRRWLSVKQTPFQGCYLP